MFRFLLSRAELVFHEARAGGGEGERGVDGTGEIFINLSKR